MFSRIDEEHIIFLHVYVKQQGHMFMPHWLINVYYSFMAVSSTLTQLMGGCPGEVTVSISVLWLFPDTAIQVSPAMCGPRKISVAKAFWTSFSICERIKGKRAWLAATAQWA